jgi:hypothetical protein
MEGINGWMKDVPQLSNDEINKYGVIPYENVKAKQRLKMWDTDDLERLDLSIDLEETLKPKPKQQQEQKPEQYPKEQKPENKSKINWSGFRIANDGEEEIDPEQDNHL